MTPCLIAYAHYVNIAERWGGAPTLDESRYITFMLRAYPELKLATKTFAGRDVLCIDGLEMPDESENEFGGLWEEFIGELTKGTDLSALRQWDFPKEEIKLAGLEALE
jgi:hypothetical protein